MPRILFTLMVSADAFTLPTTRRGFVTPPRCSLMMQYRDQRQGFVEEQDYGHQQGCEQGYEDQQGISRQDFGGQGYGVGPTWAPPASAVVTGPSYDKGARGWSSLYPSDLTAASPRAHATRPRCGGDCARHRTPIPHPLLTSTPSFLSLTPHLFVMQMDSKEGPWPFDSEEEWREAVRDKYGVTMQEDGSVLISPYGQTVLGTYLIGTFLLLLLPNTPGYAIVILLMMTLRVRCAR